MISPFACNDYRVDLSSLGKRRMCVCGYPKDEHELTKQQRSRESHTINLQPPHLQPPYLQPPRISAPSRRPQHEHIQFADDCGQELRVTAENTGFIFEHIDRRAVVRLSRSDAIALGNFLAAWAEY